MQNRVFVDIFLRFKKLATKRPHIAHTFSNYKLKCFLSDETPMHNSKVYFGRFATPFKNVNTIENYFE